MMPTHARGEEYVSAASILETVAVRIINRTDKISQQQFLTGHPPIIKKVGRGTSQQF